MEKNTSKQKACLFKFTRKKFEGKILNLTRLKIELLCKGAKTREAIEKGRKGGAGPTGGKYFILPDGTCVGIPVRGKFVENSSFTLIQKEGKWLILRGKKPLVEVKPVPNPPFYEKTTSDGTSMRKMAVLHGKDCLASTVYSKCIHWLNGQKCKFCSIELWGDERIIQKDPKQLGEVAQEAFREGVAKSITLTSGTPPGRDRGVLLLAQAAKAIKERVNLPVHVQLEPLQDVNLFETLRNAGVDTVGIHIESFDEKILADICPSKSNVEAYFESWKSAVEVFGAGQVSTFIIAGLGETDESILCGAEKAVQMGVMPYLLPLHPTEGTTFENVSPPSPERMIKLYRGVSEILHKVGLDPRKNKAGCVKYGACSAIQESFLLPP